jgi:hypothetical protein
MRVRAADELDPWRRMSCGCFYREVEKNPPSWRFVIVMAAITSAYVASDISPLLP